MLGNGKGILCDLIVYKDVKTKDEINNIVLFLKNVHKIQD